jgi:hypothetical protein
MSASAAEGFPEREPGAYPMLSMLLGMATHQGASASDLGGPENRYQGNAIPCYVGDNSLFGATQESASSRGSSRAFSAIEETGGRFRDKISEIPCIFPC